ncbi:MAG: hypothetical protein JO236_04670 [Mycobacterium sp.]|uniref:hypothetical protein n=1 Tax=Mycobacterium sp. TaxID=1785 RepID=UPI001EBAA329|nr:hypothetical protein [Mycobacterium sp.]MBW0016826.1 hypothetical protein [Mycobacterium sp.]
MSSKPRRSIFVYMIGAALIVIGPLVAIGVSVFVVVWQTSKAPTDDHGFGNTQATMVHVDAGGSKAIYTTAPSGSNIRCTAYSHQEEPPIRPYLTSTVGKWRAQSSFTVKQGGNYRISCSGPADARYAVGEFITTEQFNRLFLALFLGIGGGGVMVLAGLVVVLVTAARRGRAKRQAMPMQYPQQWPPRT